MNERSVRFIKDYTFTPHENRNCSVKYRAGWCGKVRVQCALKAVAAEAAVYVTTNEVKNARKAKRASDVQP